MARHVLLFDGPIGVGKSTLGKAVAGRLGFAGAIVAYPVRRASFIFFREILARSAEMIGQGYGQRAFSSLVFRTDEADFEVSCSRLAERLRALLDVGQSLA
ncbi:hypothetical protein [uncultured Cohaesibacter sp.]|uniref:hypothetical protein n=1 Tax=uncultured Cohaesibacter sp. TaxID=1002546 RepID=UPI0029C79E48|nr:hypothetical protein [uncultured Cohaesibacter sp.]